MKLTLKQAAELAGKTKSTILNAIKKGKISAVKDELGRWEIELCELERVYKLNPQDEPQSGTELNDIERLKLVHQLELQRIEIEHLRHSLEKSELKGQQFFELAQKHSNPHSAAA